MANFSRLQEPTRIKGSKRLEPNALHQFDEKIAAGTPVYLYCTCVREATSARVAQMLQKKGVHTTVIKGGLRAWKKAGASTGARAARRNRGALPGFDTWRLKRRAEARAAAQKGWPHITRSRPAARHRAVVYQRHFHVRLKDPGLDAHARAPRHLDEVFVQRARLLGRRRIIVLGRRPLRQSPYRVNCDITSKAPVTSSKLRFILPASSGNTRRLRIFSARNSSMGGGVGLGDAQQRQQPGTDFAQNGPCHGHPRFDSPAESPRSHTQHNTAPPA